IAATLQAAVEAARAAGGAATKESGASLTCRVRESAGEGEAKGVELRVEGAFARTPALDATLATLAREYGVGVRPAESSITSTFPA
ncbi:MAG TPA: hypothetical protein VG432_12005, partial [Gemmatimonadaceae bacterium]|nr:hypothetical protein [Gemmatimonadaceae bacterium]